MDVARILSSVPEPATSTRLQCWTQRVLARLEPEQRTALRRWFNTGPFEPAAQQALREGPPSVALLEQLAKRLGGRASVQLGDRAAAIPRVFEVARERPAVASTLVWHLLGHDEPEHASNMIQAIRERAGLPGLRARIELGELPADPATSWFDDRQVEDAAEWAERIPPPPALTLADVIARIEAQRAGAGAHVTELVPFLRRTASFLHALSKQALDPLGFGLAHEAQLVTNPPHETRLEVVTWGRTVGRILSPRGEMAIMRIALAAPWALALELVASELGRGASGAFGILMRLRGDATLPPPPQPAPVLLCIPDEPVELRGARFERWSQRAYLHAVHVWRAFA